MNKLTRAKRVEIIHLLVEGMSLRAITRVSGVSINTVTKLLVDAGRACSEYQDKKFRNLSPRRIQIDEIWTFNYCKKKNVETAKAAPVDAGDLWTFVAIDPDTKLIPSWLVGSRDGETTRAFVNDLAERIITRVQLTSDGWSAYIDAVMTAFDEVDYATLIKNYDTPQPEMQSARRYSPEPVVAVAKTPIAGNPDKDFICTSHVERQNHTMRMHMRRFTRLTNGFTKKVENHMHAVALHCMYYNFCKIHSTIKCTPAMKAGVVHELWDVVDIVRIIEIWEKAQGELNQQKNSTGYLS